MPTTTITTSIPTPGLTGDETFTVIVTNSSGTVVSTTTQTNAPFALTLDVGTGYTMSVNYNGSISLWCFDVPTCTCPSLVTIVPSESSAPYYIRVSATSFVSPYVIQVTDPSGTSIDYPINSLSDYNLHVGLLYTKLIYAPLTNYTVTILDTCGNICTSWKYSHPAGITCTGPTIEPVTGTVNAFQVERVGISGATMQAKWATNAGTCSTIIVNYSQNYVISGSPDMGSITLTAGSPGATITIDLSPNLFAYDPNDPGALSYHVTVKDCCGNTLWDSDTFS